MRSLLLFAQKLARFVLWRFQWKHDAHRNTYADLQKRPMTRVLRQLRNAYRNDHIIIAGNLYLPGIQWIWIYSDELPRVLTTSNTNITRAEEKLIEITGAHGLFRFNRDLVGKKLNKEVNIIQAMLLYYFKILGIKKIAICSLLFAKDKWMQNVFRFVFLRTVISDRW